MNLPGIVTTYLSTQAIGQYSLVVFNKDDSRHIDPAVDGKAFILGVTTLLESDEKMPTDVIRSGFADVMYGADVKAGDPLTANAEGWAVPAAAGDFIVGYAEESGAEGDIGSVWIAVGQLAAGATQP
ncbi:hypothetical protein [Providencia sp. TYF-12]|uniref:hypothetical protein n=1 Tax=unclassified Providencia TaxID=2633465 RepID=UPI003525BBBA